MGDLDGTKIVAVHAHPDDESIWTGLLLAQAARRGADVTVVTCTLGEEGEVIGEKYRRLQSDGVGMLGGYRIAELQRALEALGLRPEPLLLGGAGGWRDSGMVGTPTIERAEAFASSQAPENRDREVQQLTELLKGLQPDILVTYGPDGGYGHPDHIRAHEITHAAVDSGGLSGVRQVLWAVTEDAAFQRGLEGAVVPQGWTYPEPGEIALVDSEAVDLRIEGSPEDVSAKYAAMRAHATQVWFADGQGSDVQSQVASVPEDTPLLWCLSNLIAQPLMPTEAYAVGFTAEGVNPGYARNLLVQGS